MTGPNRPVSFRFACGVRLVGFAHILDRAVVERRGTVRLWLSIGVLCAKAVEAETIRRAETTAILSVLNIAISLGYG